MASIAIATDTLSPNTLTIDIHMTTATDLTVAEHIFINAFTPNSVAIANLVENESTRE